VEYRGFEQRARREHMLFSVLLELTYQCNLRCFYCYNDTSLQGDMLSFDQYRELLDDLNSLGTLNIGLSGGEPLAHPDFFAIGRYARGLGFVIRIKSNGHALTKQYIRRIQQEIDPFSVEISLHGATAQSHDRQTRVRGSFDALMQNLAFMKDCGLRFRINCTMTSWNETEIEDIYALGDTFGVPVNIDSQVTQRDNGDRAPLTIGPSREAMKRLIRLQMKRSRGMAGKTMPGDDEDTSMKESQETASDKTKYCGAGSSTLLIDPFGAVYPCVNWRRSVGNLHDMSIVDIWQNSSELSLVRSQQIEVRREIESNQRAAMKIGFCPGVAERLTGDAKKLYDHAKHQLSIRDALG